MDVSNYIFLNIGDFAWYLLKFLGGAIQIFIFVMTIYYLVISIFGWFKRKEVPGNRFAPQKTFALIVAAHNEEAVIGNIVRNLKGLNYPESMFDVFVIADNCMDRTAEISRQTGAIVVERFNSQKRGKGFALEYMFEKIFNMKKKYDAVCVFDADNLASRDFLLEMNKQMCRGYEVIQGYLDSKNPMDSYISASYAISFWLANRLMQLPRYYLGLSCYLGGTGFAISTNVLREIEWSAFSLTEDLEYTMKLALAGKKVYWAHDAVVYDEKPLTLKQSWNQRKRWMQGTADCIFNYFMPLLKKGVTEFDLVSLDCAFYLLYPFVILFSQILLFVNAISMTLNIASGEFAFNTTGATVVAIVFTVFVIYMNGIFIHLEGKLTLKTLWYFLIYPLYNITWIPIIVVGFAHKNRKEWSHTIHTRAIDLTEIDIIGTKKVG